MVSQIERGKTALPSSDLLLWAEALQLAPDLLANQWIYYLDPALHAALYGEDPFKIEGLPKPACTVYAAPGRPPMRLLPME